MENFIETIKLKDGKVYQLEYHQRRVNQTFKYFFKQSTVLQLNTEINKIILPTTGFFKIRIEYNANYCKTEVSPYSFRSISSFEFIHTEEDYPFKSVNRTFFDKSKKLSKADEIIFIKNKYVTDTSYSNIVFFDGDEWLTPDTFLLNGTKRQRLLEEKRIKKRPISMNDVLKFEKIGLINAMIDLNELTFLIKPELFL